MAALKEYRKVVKYGYVYLASAWVGRGRCLAMLGKYRKAGKAFRKAVRLAPDREDARWWLDLVDRPEEMATMLFYSGKWTKALAILEIENAKAELVGEARLALGFLRSDRTENPSFIEDAAHAAKDELPDTSFGLCLWGRALMHLDELDKGIGLLRRAVELAAKVGNMATLAQHLCRMPGREKEARQWYEKALAEDPESMFALVGLAQIVGETDPGRGLALAERARAVDAEYEDAHFAVAECLRRMTKYEEAIRAYTRAMELCPLDAWQGEPSLCTLALAEIGACYLSLGRAQLAEICATWVLRRHPENARAKEILTEVEASGASEAGA